MIRKIAISVFLLSGIFLFYLANQSVCTSEEEQENQTEKWSAQTNDFLSDIIEEANHFLDTVTDVEHHAFHQNRFDYFAKTNQKISHWSTNEWLPDSAAFSKTEPSLHEHQSGWDLVIPVEPQKSILTFKLLRNETGQFNRQNYITPLRGLQFDIINKPSDHILLDGAAHLAFYGKRLETGASGKKHFWGLFFLCIAAMMAYRKWLLGAFIISATAVVVRILSFKQIIGHGLDQLQIFDPVIFASSNLLPSLGDLTLHVITVVLVFVFLIDLLTRITINKKIIASIALYLLALVALFASDLIRSLLRSLIANSNISFDVTHLSSLNIYTVLSAAIVSILFWLLYVLCSTVLKRIKKQTTTWGNFLITVVVAVISFVVFQKIDASRSLEGLLPSILFATVTLLFLYATTFTIRRKIGLYKYAVFILIFTLFYSTSVQLFQKNKEAEYLNLYASKLVSNKDLQAEYMFEDMENELSQQFLVPEDFERFSQKKDQFEQRLRRLYFSGYLGKYNMLILSFDSAGNNINSSTLYSYSDLDSIYNYQSFQTLSNHFYQVKSERIFNGYLAKFENCDLYGHYGSVFILLEPKFIQSSYEYPQLVSLKKDNLIFDIDDYSYALYSNDKLLNQKGTYPYNLHFDSSHFNRKSRIFGPQSFTHFISQQDQAIVVLSHPSTLFKSAVSTFSFAFIFFSLLFIVFGILWIAGLFLQQIIIKRWASVDEYKAFRFNRQQQLDKLGIEQVYLSTRIRLSMVIIVFAGLLVSIYVTIQFIEINDQNRSENELMVKIREVANQLQNEVDFAQKLNHPESRKLIVNEIGDVYKIDANLFDSSGVLLASSIIDIYANGLVAPLMNAQALHTFKEKNTSQLLQSEQIRDLKFTSAYLPLINNKRKVIAYLNLPYYSRQKELNAEISSYTVTFVNLYLFLILVAITLAYIVSQRISKPLQIIREKMSTTGLNSNELIEWKHNDEIGQLVKQYNKMVLQLGESAQKLSESEREGAWKEMARQVAHEIKNPLTPMKLNIQHLQRAWSDKNERLEDTFKRVTTVLIEQIDSLSKLATEFSSFAQMPVNNFEDCDITNALQNTVTLFEKSENVVFQYNENWPSYYVHADKEQLGRIFNNVIKNAIQAISKDKKGLITIDVKTQNGNKILISIKDNGKGIPEDVQSKIFVPNFSTKNSGMGLGLAITRKMVEAADGRIWFKTKLHEGTTFFIEWPLVPKSE